MTLKEKVAEVEPQAIGDEYWGGVRGCPFDYEFLGIKEEECKKATRTECEECWNLEYKED